MFWIGVILCMGVECNQECRSIYSSECDIPIGALLLGWAFGILTFLVVIFGYDNDR